MAGCAPVADTPYSNHQNWRHTAGRGAFSAAEAPKTQEALMAFKFLGQRQLGKLPSRWVSTILMVAISQEGGGIRPAKAAGWVMLNRRFSPGAGLLPKRRWARGSGARCCLVTGFGLRYPKCAANFVGGCFGEIAATPNPGRGLRFPVGWVQTCDWPQSHHYAAV